MSALSKSSCTQCSLCDDTLLRHFRKGGTGWFCPTCRQDMPLLQSATAQTVLSEPADICPEKVSSEKVAANRTTKVVSADREYSTIN